MTESPNIDILTGLPASRYYWAILDEMFANDPDDYCMLTLDIEHFSFFNKWYGRKKGDDMLNTIGSFLVAVDRVNGTHSGYMGGDNFSITFKRNAELASDLCAGIRNVISMYPAIDSSFRPFFGGYINNNKEIKPTAIEMYDYTVTAINKAMETMDSDVYWVDDVMAERMQKEIDLMPKIHMAMKNGEFTFFLQPKCFLNSGKIIGAEALVRWVSPTEGMISPGKFIPVMEKNGFITYLDKYVWELVCKTIRRWMDEGRRVLPISVNVSRIDVYALDIVQVFTSLIEKYKVPATFIEIEITESAYVENEAIIKDAEEALKKAGFKILIDDFGSGYSSLNMLKDVDADVLKLDMRFLDLNESNNAKGLQIIGSVLNMAHEIDLPTIAEGIETEFQKQMLTLLGCEYAQGYYFYKPLPIPEYEKLLENPSLVADSAVQQRKLGRSYLNELAEYFWKVAEVNPYTGEYRFIRKFFEPDFITTPRPVNIWEYISRYIKNGFIHQDDITRFQDASCKESLLDQLRMNHRKRRTHIRYFIGDGFRWFAFETIRSNQFSEDNPWMLFAWKEADVDTANREDTLSVMYDAFRTIIKLNPLNGDFSIIKANPKELSDFSEVSKDIFIWAKIFAGRLHTDDMENFYKFIDVVAVRRHFISGGGKLEISVRHKDKDNNYHWLILTLMASLDFTPEEPELMFTVRECDADPAKHKILLPNTNISD